MYAVCLVVLGLIALVLFIFVLCSCAAATPEFSPWGSIKAYFILQSESVKDLVTSTGKKYAISL